MSFHRVLTTLAAPGLACLAIPVALPACTDVRHCESLEDCGGADVCRDGVCTPLDLTSASSFVAPFIVSATPGRKTAAGWRRVCDGGPVDGLLTDVVLVRGILASNTRDLALRPGDLMRDPESLLGVPLELAEADVGLELDCIDPVPGSGSHAAGDCLGAAPGEVTVDDVSFVARTPSHEAAHDVVLLIDTSGSLGGNVDDERREGPQGSFDPPPNFGELASDRHALRLAAARTFVATFADRDRVCVLAFGESLLSSTDVAIADEDGIGDTRTPDLPRCFATDHATFTGPTGIDNLLGRTAGRSNLWSAVKLTYDALRADGTGLAGSSADIVVVTDGPDTCVPGEDAAACDRPCSGVSATDVLATIAADQAIPGGKHVAVHFIQFESIGYPGRDRRQVEVACASGGQYQFIDTNSMPPSQLAAPSEALDQAFLQVRFMLGGAWRIASLVPTFVSGGGDGGTPVGSLYALAGTLAIHPSSGLVSAERSFGFDVGVGTGAVNATTWDRRPSVLKSCSDASDCGSGDCCEGACRDRICSVCAD